MTDIGAFVPGAEFGVATPEEAAMGLDVEIDVIAMLIEQHERVNELFDDTEAGKGDRRQEAFDRLRALLVLHETGEDVVIRPVIKEELGPDAVDIRRREEHEISVALAALEKLDVESPEFTDQLVSLRTAVTAHNAAEESEEFPVISARRSLEERWRLARLLLRVQRSAPTHAHPTTAGNPVAKWTIGPVIALADRALDAATHDYGTLEQP